MTFYGGFSDRLLGPKLHLLAAPVGEIFDWRGNFFFWTAHQNAIVGFSRHPVNASISAAKGNRTQINGLESIP